MLKIKKAFSKKLSPHKNKKQKMITKVVAFSVLAVVALFTFRILNNGSFDLRQQASVKDGLVEFSIKPINPITNDRLAYSSGKFEFFPDKRYRFPVYMNTGNTLISDIEGEFVFANWEGVRITDVKADVRRQRNLKLSKLEVNGNRVKFAFTLKDKSKGFGTNNTRKAIAYVTFYAKSNNSEKVANRSFSIDWNRSASKAYLFGAEGDDQLKTPTSVKFQASKETYGSWELVKKACNSDADCGADQCYQPPVPKCPEGLNCAQVMPQAYCVRSNVSLLNPSQCQVDEDCASGMICHGGVMPNCSDELNCAQVMPVGVCVPEETAANMTLQSL